ncbi:hypothetical protein [Bradyrhizobium iriomotense]|uniref:Integrase n=1 Tax=Bradyrhizobium iriomotense TaxID=441950 RepID=A0ABQ6BAP0_9BRAD|nr:hypothetical protein [Bradyrhizobium iriomotense]GLR91434.1 hypothetical protein GCM10007857_81510 [Bradyrhizobium iriomotense]
MDANNVDPFDVSGRPEAHHAILQQEQAGQAGQEDFEQRLAEGRQANAAPPAGATPDPRYPHLTEKDRTLIDAAAEHFGRNVQSHTVGTYTWALRVLGNHLGFRSQTIDALDHDSLLWHANAFFPTDGSMVTALNALRKYREPRASDGCRRYVPSVEDGSLIEAAIRAAAGRRRWTPSTAENNEQILRRLAKSLESQGQTIAASDHNSLVAYVKESFGDDVKMPSVLEVLREYREPDFLAARVPRREDEYIPSREDKDLIDSAVLASGRPEHTVKRYTDKLYRFAGVLKDEGQGIAKLDHGSLIRRAKRLYSSNKNLITGLNIIRDYRNAQGDAAGSSRHAEAPTVQSPVASVNSEELLRRLDDQPTPSRSIYDPAELRNASDQTGQLPAESLDTAELLGILASPTHSPADSVDQPSPALPLPVQAVAPEETWRAADKADQLPTESLDTAELLEILASPTHSPTASVNQPNPSPLWDIGASTSRPAYLAVHAPLAVPDLDLYLPQNWQHGDQWATEDFMHGMRLHNVLPSVAEPQTNLTIQGVNYTATVGHPGWERAVFLRRS